MGQRGLRSRSSGWIAGAKSRASATWPVRPTRVREKRRGLAGVAGPAEAGEDARQVVRADGAQIHPNRVAAAQHEADIAYRELRRDCAQERGDMAPGEAQPLDMAGDPAPAGGCLRPAIMPALHRQEDRRRTRGARAGAVPFQKEAVEIRPNPSGIVRPGVQEAPRRLLAGCRGRRCPTNSASAPPRRPRFG